MKDILSEIVAHKRTEVEAQKQIVTPDQLQHAADALLQAPTCVPRSMKQALATSPSGIIAEFKRRSPSKGWIKQEARAEEIPTAYEAAGAAALSILTDEHYFGGTLHDVRTARSRVRIPILRKEFIIDEYQLLQARIVGADAVLLIAACLTPQRCEALTAYAHRLGLEVLLEIHSESELAYLSAAPDMVGVNNRHLGSFVTDVETSFRLAENLQRQVRSLTQHASTDTLPLLVSESGLSRPDTVLQLRQAGYRGFLMGEAFMKTPCPGETLHQFIRSLS